MSANLVKDIAVPTVNGQLGDATDVCQLKAELRRFEFVGSPGDKVEIHVSAKGLQFSGSFVLFGPYHEVHLNDRACHYRAMRLEGTNAATLTVTGEPIPA